MTSPSWCATDPVLAALCHAIAHGSSSVAGAAAQGLLGELASGTADGASWLLTAIGHVMTTSTTISVNSDWFVHHYRQMATLASILILPLLGLAVIQAIFRQNLELLIRSALVHLPLALILAGMSLQLVELSLAMTDELCRVVSSGSGASLRSALARIVTSLNHLSASGSGIPPLVVVFGAVLVTLGALFLWLELLVRASAVYVAVLFLPLALASLVWPAISHWCRRLVDTLAALVLSKFVIVAILSMAGGAIASTQGGYASLLAGSALLFLAAFAPIVLLRLVPVIEASAATTLDGIRHRAVQEATFLPKQAASWALRYAGFEGLPVDVAPGIGMSPLFEAPGASADVSHQDGKSNNVGGGGHRRGRGSQAPTGSDPDRAPRQQGVGGRPGRPVASDLDGTQPGDRVPMWQSHQAANAAYREAMSETSRASDAHEPTKTHGQPSSAGAGSWALHEDVALESDGGDEVSPTSFLRSPPIWGGVPTAPGEETLPTNGSGDHLGSSDLSDASRLLDHDVEVGPGGRYEIGHDHMGPVIRWQRPSTGPTDGLADGLADEAPGGEQG